MKALKEAQSRFKSEINIQSNLIAADRHMYIESTSTIIKSPVGSQIENNKNMNMLSSRSIAVADINKLNAYRYEIKQVRQQRDNETMLKKDLIEKILVTWKELKDIRTKRGFRNTDLKLVIKKLAFFENLLGLGVLFFLIFKSSMQCNFFFKLLIFFISMLQMKGIS